MPLHLTQQQLLSSPKTLPEWTTKRKSSLHPSTPHIAQRAATSAAVVALYSARSASWARRAEVSGLATAGDGGGCCAGGRPGVRFGVSAGRRGTFGDLAVTAAVPLPSNVRNLESWIS